MWACVANDNFESLFMVEILLNDLDPVFTWFKTVSV